jgi:hypothetical protein
LSQAGEKGAIPMQREAYAAPTITAIGSLRELTQNDECPKSAGSGDFFMPRTNGENGENGHGDNGCENGNG